ncbi:hypothetical protein MJ1HA_1817 [Metallosphaera sedula]|nr:hypothetical protein MJ1HA_1817 [Metallosphaera sedula]
MDENVRTIGYAMGLDVVITVCQGKALARPAI